MFEFEFTIAIVGCCAMCLPVLGLMSVLFGVLPAMRQRAHSMGEALEFEPGPAAKQMRWWVGRYGGRDAGLVPIVLPLGNVQLNQKHQPGLRLALAVHCDPLEVIVYRSVQGTTRPVDFETAFGFEGDADSVPVEVQQAMLDHVRTHEGALRIRNRPDAPKGLLGRGMFPDASVVVTTEFLSAGVDLDEVRRRFDGLARIADALEAAGR